MIARKVNFKGIRKIVIDLIPETSFGYNIRSEFPNEWEILRRICYNRANHICEICSESGKNQGFRHSVECHELWEYDIMHGIQKLVNFIALCPLCHRCHHIGFAEIKGNLPECIERISKINQMPKQAVVVLLRRAKTVWETRSRIKWKLDTAFIKEYIK